MSELSLPTCPKRPEFKGGTWIAQLSLRMLALTSSLALTGCLAFDKVELPEIPDYPPSVIDDVDTPYPSTGIIELDFTGGNTEPLVLMVIVRDPNISQRLTYRVFIDGTPNDAGLRVSETVPPTLPVAELDRPVTIEVPTVRLSPPGCHRVELIVSGAFDSGVDPRKPERPNDFASMVWWVRSSDSAVTIDLQACPDMLVPVQRDPEPT